MTATSLLNATGDQTLSAQKLLYKVEAKTLLNDVSIRAEGGEFVGLLGPNGAGKSTLLRAIAGILGCQSGTVRLGGTDLELLSPKHAARELALVPQVAPYTGGFTSIELVLMGRYPHLGCFQVEGKEDQCIVRETMRLTETEQLAERTLDTLSGGEQQRVFLSRALAQQPCILLLDEPTSNLDVLHQIKVFEVVRELVSDGLTAIAAIHDLNMAARYCDRLVLLTGGRILAEGLPEEVLSPERLEEAFGVESRVRHDPLTGSVVVTVIGPA